MRIKKTKDNTRLQIIQDWFLMPIFLSYCTFSSKCFFFFFYPGRNILVFVFARTLAVLCTSQYIFSSGFLLCFEASLIIFVFISSNFRSALHFCKKPPTACFNNMLVWLKGKFCCVSFLSENKHTNKQTKLEGVTLYIRILVGHWVQLWSKSPVTMLSFTL